MEFPGKSKARSIAWRCGRRSCKQSLAWHAALAAIGVLEDEKMVENAAKLGKVLAKEYPELKRISIDYALMEPASKDPALSVCVVPMSVDWKDVGSWPSYGETLPADADGNRTNAVAVHRGSSGVLARASKRSTSAQRWRAMGRRRRELCCLNARRISCRVTWTTWQFTWVRMDVAWRRAGAA